MKISRLGVVATFLFALALVVAAQAQEKAATTATKTTAAKSAAPAKSGGPRDVIGEVVDPACWLVNGAKGDTHKECAIACAKSGQTLAILERKTNKLYLLVTERPGEDPNKALIDFVGQTVLVKGKVHSRGGALGIQVASVEPAPKK
jgi:hypothetical protein